MYVLACCDSNGECIGFLDKNKHCESREEKVNDSEWIKENLLTFKRKKDTTELCNQINLSFMLLPEPNKYPFRIVPVKV